MTQKQSDAASQNEMLEYYFTEEQVSAFLNMSVKGLRDCIYNGRNHPPFRKFGRKTLFPKKEFWAWTNRQPLHQEISQASG